MKVLLVGGGSGGHVIPLRAVACRFAEAEELSELLVVTDKGFEPSTKQIFADMSTVDVKAIPAGKFRRYADKSLVWYILHPSVILLNIRDVFYVLVGIMRSISLLRQYMPAVIFAKGGFVCVPVGIAARICKIPMVIHESDSSLGLANRILSKWARAVAVSYPVEMYNNIPKSIVYETGVPISSDFRPVSKKQQIKLRHELGLNEAKPLLLILGGGTGAEALNKIIAGQARSLLDVFQIVHFTGKGKVQTAKDVLNMQIIDSDKITDYHIIDFTTEVSKYIQAADVVISRAGASAIREVVAVEKPLLLVPGAQLSGGHQVKNAKLMAEQGMAVWFDEDDLLTNGEILTRVLLEGFESHAFKDMVRAMAKYNKATPDALDLIAKLIEAAADYESTSRSRGVLG